MKGEAGAGLNFLKRGPGPFRLPGANPRCILHPVTCTPPPGGQGS